MSRHTCLIDGEADKQPHVHDHARCTEAGRDHCHQYNARLFPHPAKDSGRIPHPDPLAQRRQAFLVSSHRQTSTSGLSIIVH